MISLEEVVAITIIGLVLAGGGAMWFVFVRGQDMAERRRRREQERERSAAQQGAASSQSPRSPGAPDDPPKR